MILKRWVWFTGIVGMIITFAFSTPLSRYSFGNTDYSFSIKMISIILLIYAISEGKIALLQGLRKIGTMAKAKVMGIIWIFFLTVPLYWFFGISGIVPAIILTYSIMLFFAVYYTRRIPIVTVKLGIRDTFTGGLGMIKLGFFLVLAGLSNTAIMYIVRGFITQKSGILGVGQFQAAWNLSNIYLSAVLQAMASDYFPRLSAVNDNNEKVVRLVNEQTEIALLISGPLLVGMLTFVNIIIMVLYTVHFTDTIRILHWQLAGTLLKVVSWPLGFILLAKGLGRTFMTMEIISRIFYIVPIYLFWDTFGIEVTGIAYIFSYIIYLFMVFYFARRYCLFTWSRESKGLVIVFSFLTVLSFFITKYLDAFPGLILGILVTITASTFSYIKIRRLVDLKLSINNILKKKK